MGHLYIFIKLFLKFEVKAGTLYLYVGEEKTVLKSGYSALVPKSTLHRFYNVDNDLVKFRITF